MTAKTTFGQLSLFGDEDVEKPLKEIVVSRLPTADTIYSHTWGAVYRLKKADDAEFLRIWKYAHVQDWLNRMNLYPKGYKWSRHNWLAVIKHEDLEAIDDEFKRRGLHNKYCLVLELSHLLDR